MFEYVKDSWFVCLEAETEEACMKLLLLNFLENATKDSWMSMRQGLVPTPRLVHEQCSLDSYMLYYMLRVTYIHWINF